MPLSTQASSNALLTGFCSGKSQTLSGPPLTPTPKLPGGPSRPVAPFISGLKIPLYSQPQLFEVLPASGALDPAVFITLDDVKAAVDGSGGEDELVLTVDVSP